MSVAAIVLAAGASSRLGQPKQLLIQDGETLLERAVGLANEAGAAPVIYVLGAYRERISAREKSKCLHNAILAINDGWELGISSSIHVGLRALDAVAPTASGALILPCDQPRLTTDHLLALIDTFEVQSVPSIVASTYAGVHGVPAVFPRAAFADLFSLRGDKGARALLKQPSQPLIALPFAGGEIDIDQPGDLAQLG